MMSEAALAARREYNRKIAEKYRNTPQGKAAIRAAQQRYYQTPQGKAAVKAAHERYWERKAAQQLEQSAFE